MGYDEHMMRPSDGAANSMYCHKRRYTQYDDTEQITHAQTRMESNEA